MIGERFFQMLSGVTTPAKWFLDWAGASPSSSGVTVSEQSALTYSAVWAATRLLCGMIAGLPLKVYKWLPDDRGRNGCPDHPLYSLLHNAPNDDMDSFSFYEAQCAVLINWGNAYSEIIRLGSDDIVALMPLHPIMVTPEWDKEKNEVYYLVRDIPHAMPRVVRKKDMWHITGTLSEEGIVGKGVIRQARESIGMGMATEKYGAAFFGNGARPGGVLEHPGTKALSPEAGKQVLKEFNAAHQGVDKAQLTALLREGITYKAIGIPPEEAQFLETRVHNISEIARWYGLPPSKLADLSHAAYTNIEHESLNFVMYSLMPWLRRIECSINRQLLNGSKEYYAEFVVDGLLRGDKKTRTEANVMEFMHGKATLNELRAKDNQNPIDSKYGDEHFVPLNLVPLDKIEEVMQKWNEAPPPKAEPDGPPNPKSAPEKPKLNSAALDAAVTALSEATKRLISVEINAVRRAAKHPDKFMEKVEGFYLRHVFTVTSVLLPLYAVRNEIDRRFLTPEGTRRYLRDKLRQRQEAALAASECLPAELPAAIEKLTQSWLDELEDENDKTQS